MSNRKPIIEFDVAVIGAGQAGLALAMTLAGRGDKVGLIEGGLVGGSCVNYGCTPTKTLRKSARRQMEVRRREARVGRAIGSLETPLPADLHIAVGGDLGHRHRIRAPPLD